MKKSTSKYQLFKDISVLTRIVIAVLFTSSILIAELVKMNELKEQLTIENIDFSEKNEAEKEGQKESPNEPTEVDDFCHSFMLAFSSLYPHISHNYHYQAPNSDFHLNIPEEPPQV